MHVNTVVYTWFMYGVWMFKVDMTTVDGMKNYRYGLPNIKNSFFMDGYFYGIIHSLDGMTST